MVGPSAPPEQKIVQKIWEKWEKIREKRKNLEGKVTVGKTKQKSGRFFHLAPVDK